MWVITSQVKLCWTTGVRRWSTSARRQLQLEEAAVSKSKNSKNSKNSKTQNDSDVISNSSNDGAASVKGKDSRNFLEEQNFRRTQALKSILVQVPSIQFAAALQKQCENFGQIESMFHYRQNDKEFILAELDNKDSVSTLLKSAFHQKREDIVPVRTRLLDGSALSRNLKSAPSDVKLVEEKFSSPDLLDKELGEISDISKQMDTLYQRSKLPELGARLRYFISSQIEDAISGIFPCNRVYLFGSSVNGFGHHNSDVDMILDFDVGHTEKRQSSNECALCFISKTAAGNERVQTQRSLELLADHLQYLLPGYSNVQRILLARVPIVKFNHEVSGIQCDLSITNMSGLVMSDYLFTLGQIDDRLRALVVTIRRWAKSHALTNPHPGRWITNFTLTIMAVFFMQQKDLLPPLNKLKRHLPKKDDVVAGSDDLKSLLLQFFEFYSSFDYKRHAISVIEGVAYPKPDFASLYIENPVETELNICRNLSAEELTRIVSAMQSASWLLESVDPSSAGILRLFSEVKVDLKKRGPTQVEEYFDGGRRDSPSFNKFQPDEFVVQTVTANGSQRKRLNSQIPFLSEKNQNNSVKFRRRNSQQPGNSGFKHKW